jgi:pyruvate, water dikinase
MMAAGTLSIAPLTARLDEALYGGKAAQLAVAVRAGLPVPQGVALSAQFVTAVTAGRPEALRQLAELADLVQFPVAVRSSAVGEDSASASFAGQHLTRLNVRSPEELETGVRAVWESARSESALLYRRRLGLPEEPLVGVVVQELVMADCAGVLFTCNPVDGAEELVAEASWGLGETVVAGLVIPERLRIDRSGAVIEHVPGDKDVAIVPSTGGGTVEERVPDDRQAAYCLDEAAIEALIALAARCDALFGGPSDIEWALAGGRLHLLQRRPLTTAAREPQS